MATAHPDLTRGAFGGGGCDLDPRMDLSGREQQSHGEEEEEEEEEEAALDDLEPLDLDSMCASQGDSQETWLYITHSPDSGLSSITPLQWCRQTLDSPKLESTRRSLSSRLEQAPLTSPLHPHLLRTLSPVPRDLSPGPQDLSPMAERSPTFLSHLSKRSRSLQRAMFSPQSPVDPENPVCAEFKLQDLTDVQVMARMQEDSLRQELSLPRPRRSLSLSSFSGALSGHEEDESGDNCALLLPPAPPLSRLAHSHTLHNFHSLRNWPTAAAPPSPPPPSDGYGYSATGLETPQYTPLAYRRQASVSGLRL
ncbi:unnamed protein product [Knipowitschia caucasica]|uniref:Uncharacterized protein n=1 Tax=Knipowitschia caucasica TaxID=637954 RepID=A0AAV2L716_KNICA